MKKLIIAGGSGFLGNGLINYFEKDFEEIVILTRSSKNNFKNVRYVVWDAEHLGDWVKELEYADVIINMCGKSVDCRYTDTNKALIISSRVNSTNAIGKAIEQCQHPPGLWMNAASATIYKHSETEQMSEIKNEYGSGFSVEVCKAWEKAFYSFNSANTRKINLRITMVMGRTGGVFPVLSNLVKKGLGGTMGNGRQMVSWIHIDDLCRMLRWLIENKGTNGNYNLAAPVPITNKDLMSLLRKAYGVSIGLPAFKWMLEIGAFFLRTETELILKSRNVIPARAEKEGFEFLFRDMHTCVKDLIKEK